MSLKKLHKIMTEIASNIDDEDFLQSVNYNPENRDCGYRSTLLYLRMQMTEATNTVANHVIYNRSEPIPCELLEEPERQLQLIF